MPERGSPGTDPVHRSEGGRGRAGRLTQLGEGPAGGALTLRSERAHEPLVPFHGDTGQSEDFRHDGRRLHEWHHLAHEGPCREQTGGERARRGSGSRRPVRLLATIAVARSEPPLTSLASRMTLWTRHNREKLQGLFSPPEWMLSS